METMSNILYLLSYSLSEIGAVHGVLGISDHPFGLTRVASVAHTMFAADLLSYIGIIAVTALIGAKYKIAHAALVQRTLHLSAFFCYVSVLIVSCSLWYYADLLAIQEISIFSGLYTFSIASQVLKILFLFIVGGLYTLFSDRVAEQLRSLELPLLIQITLALCITAISASNIALILLALEGFSLTLYVMTALARNYGGITASVKYFAFGTLGSIFLFWGAVHIYASTGSLSISSLNSDRLDFAATAMAFGFLLKIGAAPVHQWVADTYAGVHMFITAYFSIFVKCVLFLIFLKVASQFNCDTLVVQFSVISLVVGCFMSVNQSEIKRLLAYSSIVHVGFLLMGDTASSIVYLLTYLLSSFAIFAVLLGTEVGGREIVYFNDLKQLRAGSSLNIVTLVVALASSAGLPPFAGFYGKFLVWTSLIEDIYLSNTFAAYCTLFTSVFITLITIFYYMRIVAYLFVGDDTHNYVAKATASVEVDFFYVIFSLQGFVTLLLIFWTFVQPYAVDLAHLISSTL